MNNFFKGAEQLFQSFGILDAVDILLISLAVYIAFKFLIKNNAHIIVKFFIAFTAVAVLISMLELNVSSIAVKYIILLFFFAVIIIYASEIKRLIWLRKKKFEFEKFTQQSCTEEDLEIAADHVVKAVQNMAKKDIGALIVFVIDQPPTSILESGIPLGSIISSQLIESIFIPKAPLHDGAVLIKDNRILAAGCFLPLSLEVNMPKEFGTRHRAAIGITEQYNVMAVVVSEETGIISLARNGILKRYIDGEMLREAVESAYGLKTENDNFWKNKTGEL
ncbi:MAG: diadenylate cyclase CdaA [Clostridia bacterium]|nr:diadenylate cyclase CdaA [Clostridia bacterium]